MKTKTISIITFIDWILLTNFALVKRTEFSPNLKKKIISKVYLNSMKILCQYSSFIILKLLLFSNQISLDPLIDNANKPIVSLTSFPVRIKNLWMVIFTLFNQSLKPGKVILTLTNQEFPNGINQIPNSLKQFVGKGLEIMFVDVNLKPHNKYFFTFQQFPNRNIITVDDDLLYYTDTIERLIDLHLKYPNTICSNRIQQISLNNCEFDKTGNWKHVYTPTQPSHYNFALGYGSVFYPQNFRGNLLFDINRIKLLCPMADDLWLKSMELIENIYVVSGEYYAHPIIIPFSQKVALRFSNSEKNVTGNDDQWDNLNSEFELYNKFITNK